MIVIADDITGAAELAGIAFSRGLHAELFIADSSAGLPDATVSKAAADGVLVIATDTRSMSEQEAVSGTRRIVSLLQSISLLASSNSNSIQSSLSKLSLFKKTDSALRGHISAELQALMEATGAERAVFLPANPSKGRIIADGVYYIRTSPQRDFVPIHETAFNYDPEFPATTSVMRERFPEAESKCIIMPDAKCLEDINSIVAQYNDGRTLFAGAADLFEAICPPRSLSPKKEEETHLPLGATEGGYLFLCGSTQSTTLPLDIPRSDMPLEVYDGSNDLSLWLADARAKYEAAGSLILGMAHHHRTGKTAAVHLRQQMARLAALLMKERTPRHLIIEGGATAFATLNLTGWRQFSVVAQPAPGVVTLSVSKGQNTPLITLKPGSYPWHPMTLCYEGVYEEPDTKP